MNLKRIIAFTAALAAAVSFAQEDDEDVVETSDEAVAEAPAKPAAPADRPYFTIPVCSRVDGRAEVLKPNSKTWAKLEEGRFYPLGSSFRAAKDSSLTIAFGKECAVTAGAGASFTTRAQMIGTPSRTIVPTAGEVSVKLPVAMPAGLFVITTPGFTIRNAAGESSVIYNETGDGSDATIKCVTGSIAVEGRHFTIPAMRAADAFRVRTSHDGLESIIYGKSGDYVMRLDKGQVSRPEIQDDGTTKDSVAAEYLDWHLSVGTYVQINRAVPAIGERMSVCVMTFDPAGTMKNNFAFAEGRGEVNTGELVPQGEGEDSVKRDEADATTDSAADVEDEEVEETSTDEEATDDSSSDDEEESDDDDDDF